MTSVQSRLICLAAMFFTIMHASAQATKEIVVAHVYSRTGLMESYGRQTQDGLMLGLEYATGGTMKLGDRTIRIVEKDDQGKPDVGKRLLEQAFADENAVMAVGASSSGVALALLPVAEQYKKVLIVEPAVWIAHAGWLVGWMQARRAPVNLGLRRTSGKLATRCCEAAVAPPPSSVRLAITRANHSRINQVARGSAVECCERHH